MGLLQDAMANCHRFSTLRLKTCSAARRLPLGRYRDCAWRVLEKLRIERGLPERIVIENGTEFTSKALDPTITRSRCTSPRLEDAWRND